MNDRERFLAVVNGEKPDYIPIFGFPWAPGVACGCMRKTYDNLLRTGMPDIGGCWELDGTCRDLAGWQKYWGVESPASIDFYAANGWGGGIKSERYVKDGFEYIE